MTKRIIVIGSGLGGITTVLALRNILTDTVRIHLVSDRDTFDFTPSNPWIALGWRSADQVSIALPPLLADWGIDFDTCGVAQVHPKERSVELGDGQSVDYDFLIVATGPQLAFDEVKGLSPDRPNVGSVCTLDHAFALRAKIDSLADRPGPVTVGAAAGASCFGPAYEFALMLDTELRRRGLRDRVPLRFVTPEPYLGHLGLEGVGNSREMFEQKLGEREIDWRVNARVTEIGNDDMTFEQVDEQGAVMRSETWPSVLTMLIPAFRGVSALSDVEGLTNPRGFVIVDKHQRNPTFPEVFAVGVCIAIAPTGKTALPVGVPKTGYMIEGMAAAVAANIKAIIDGQAPTAEATWNAICLADFGDDGVAIVAQPQLPPRTHSWASQGSWVHHAKVLFERYFLHKVRTGRFETIPERMVLGLFGLGQLKKDGME